MAFDIESYVQDNLQAVKRSTGSELNCTCPFCDKPGRFYINTDTGCWICFKCEEKGRNVAAIIAVIEGMTIEQAKAAMMKRSVQFKRRKETPAGLVKRIRGLRGADEEPEAEALVNYKLPEEFQPVWKGGKWRTPEYMLKRGFTRDTMKAWGIGFCNSGRYGGRVIIPVICPNGSSFTARDATGEQQPRYLNPKGADHGRLFCGWNMVGDEADIVIVEGPLDAIKMWQHGIPSLSLMGKELHAEQLALLLKKPSDTSVIVMLDPEEAVAPYKAALKLLCRFDSVYIARLPDGVDPGASTKEQATQAVQDAVRFRGERGGAVSRLLAKTRLRMEEIHHV